MHLQKIIQYCVVWDIFYLSLGREFSQLWFFQQNHVQLYIYITFCKFILTKQLLDTFFDYWPVFGLHFGQFFHIFYISGHVKFNCKIQLKQSPLYLANCILYVDKNISYLWLFSPVFQTVKRIVSLCFKSGFLDLIGFDKSHKNVYRRIFVNYMFHLSSTHLA